jgi:hypothetical protein
VVVLVAVGCAAEPTGQAGGAGAASQIGLTVQALGNKPHSSCTSATHDGHLSDPLVFAQRERKRIAVLYGAQA